MQPELRGMLPRKVMEQREVVEALGTGRLWRSEGSTIVEVASKAPGILGCSLGEAVDVTGTAPACNLPHYPHLSLDGL